MDYDSPFGEKKSDDAINNELSDELSDPENVQEVHGNTKNFAELGAPKAEPNTAPLRYYFYPTWRSQLFQLVGYFVLCGLAIWGSEMFPQLTITGPIVPIGDSTIYLYLPLLILIPGFFLGKILIYMYDSKYIIDERGVEAQVGLVSLNLRQPRLRYEDIRGVEPNQTILERMFGIGSVLIGSAMTQDVEIVMEGVANPRAIQLLIQGERDRRRKRLQGESSNSFGDSSGD